MPAEIIGTKLNTGGFVGKTYWDCHIKMAKECNARVTTDGGLKFVRGPEECRIHTHQIKRQVVGLGPKPRKSIIP